MTEQLPEQPVDTIATGEETFEAAPKDDAPPATPTKKGKNAPLIVAFVAIILGAAAAGGIYLVNQQQTETQEQDAVTQDIDNSLEELDSIVSEIDESSYSEDTLSEITEEFLGEDLDGLNISDIPDLEEEL